MRTNGLTQLSMLCVLLTAGSRCVRAQAPAFTDLIVDIENVVEYQGDIADPLTFGKNPQVTYLSVFR